MQLPNEVLDEEYEAPVPPSPDNRDLPESRATGVSGSDLTPPVGESGKKPAERKSSDVFHDVLTSVTGGLKSTKSALEKRRRKWKRKQKERSSRRAERRSRREDEKMRQLAEKPVDDMQIIQALFSEVEASCRNSGMTGKCECPDHYSVKLDRYWYASLQEYGLENTREELQKSASEYIQQKGCSTRIPVQVEICMNVDFRLGDARVMVQSSFAKLAVLLAGPGGKEWKIYRGESKKVGRKTTPPERDVAIVVEDAARIASRIHCQITVSRDGKRIEIEDLQSDNGTFLDKKKLRPFNPCPTHDGAIITLGKLKKDGEVLEGPKMSLRIQSLES